MLQILQLTHKFPYPYVDGGAVAVSALAEGLHLSGVILDLFSLNTDKHQASADVIAELEAASVYRYVYTGKIQSQESPWGAIQHLIFSGSGNYFVSRFFNDAIDQRLKALLSDTSYDAIILESLYMASYIETIRLVCPETPIVLRAHNIEFELRTQQAQLERNILRKSYLYREIKKLARFEKRVWQEVDLIATVSEREATEIKKSEKKCKVVSIPIGMNVEGAQPPSRSSGTLHIGFIGSLDWSPNLNGLKWFFKNVWSQFDEREDVRCSIAGAHANKDKDYLRDQNVEFLGEVPSSLEYMRSLDLLVVPIFSGSGTRVKILEAMSLGIPVLSTTLGAEGIPIIPDKNILIGETAAEWIDHIDRSVNNQSALVELGANGKVLIKEDYNIETLGRKLLQEIECLSKQNIIG